MFPFCVWQYACSGDLESIQAAAYKQVLREVSVFISYLCDLTNHYYYYFIFSCSLILCCELSMLPNILN